MSKPYNIRRTTDYDAFQRITGNRIVRPAHVKKLKLAIEQDPETIKYNPILVNEKMQIIDGQHRYQACQLLDLPIYYVMVEGLKLEEVQKFNSVAKQWQPMDYAQAFAELGNQNYQYYLDIKRSDLSVNHDSLLRYLALGEPITGTSFTEGRLVVPDYNRSVELLYQLHEVGTYYERFNIRSFALAFLKLAQDERYDHKRMIASMKEYASLIEDYSKESDYFKALNKVYNWRRNEKNKVYFGDQKYLLEN
jgi:hypothetical protein